MAGALVLLALACGRSATYSGEGDVVAVDEPPRHVTIAHGDIAGLMPAMTMDFAVRAPQVLAGVTPGMHVRFQVVREGQQVIVTQVVPAGAPAAGQPGVHDHTPHHDGVVAMAGLLHLEARAEADGRVRVWLSDAWRRPLPLDGVTGTVTLDTPDGRRTLTLVASADALEAGGPPLAGDEVRAHVHVVAGGEPVDLHFVLPLAGATAGAAVVPADGCRPLAPDPARPGPRCVLEFPRPVSALATSPDGTLLLVALVEAGVTVWRLPAATLVTGLAAPPPVRGGGDESPHGDSANAIAVSPDGRDAVVAFEGRLFRYSTASGRLLRQLAAAGRTVHQLAWSGDRLLVSAFYDPGARLLSAADGTEQRRIAVEREATAIAFSTDGVLAAAGSDAGELLLFETSTDAPVRRLPTVSRRVDAVAFAGDRLFAATAEGVLRGWPVTIAEGPVLVDVGTPVARLAADRDGRRLASAGLDRALRLHDVASGAVRATLAWHGGAVTGLAWAGPVLVSADTEGRVALWDVGDRLTP